MSTKQIDAILEQTLADFTLSRGEKRALKTVLEDLDADERQLALLRHRAFEIARRQVAGPEGAALIGWLEGVVKVLQPKAPGKKPFLRVYFSPRDDCPRKIAGLFSGARRKVDVCVFTITDNRISEAIASAHRRGVAIRIITDNDKADDRGSDVDELQGLGIPVRLDRGRHHMHHKFAVFDDAVTLSGSYNWTRGAAEHNEENFIVSDDSRLAKAFAGAFERLWRQFG